MATADLLDAVLRVLDRLPYAVALVTPDGAWRHANRMALAARAPCLAAGDAPGRSGPAQAQPGCLLSPAAADAKPTMPAVAPSTFDDRRCPGCERRLLLHKIGLDDAPGLTGVAADAAALDALLFALDPAPDAAAAPGPDPFARIWGLTPAEARLAAALVAGTSPAAFARRHGLTVNTVKSQLRAIFRKTGTHRQAELVRLLLLTGAIMPAAERPENFTRHHPNGG